MKTSRQDESGPGGRHSADRQAIEEKLRILRLLRALDRAGVNPEHDTSVRVPLVRLSEVDGFLTAMLELSQREGEDEDEGFRQSVQSLLPISEALRGEVLDALPPDLQKAVRRTSSEVVANQAEVMLEVESFRRRAPKGEGRTGPLNDLETQRLAEEMWTGAAPAAQIRPDRRVRAHEAKPPPDPDAPLRAWFDRAPRPWREVMAAVHDLRRKGAGALAVRLAERVSDPVWMRHFLATRLGASEREMLARFLSSPAQTLGADATNMQGALAVAWDWAREFPASVGGKLRAAGLLHIGSEAGTRLAIVPPPLLPMLRDLLRQVDPGSAAQPERAMRQVQAEAVRGTPFEGEALAHWKKIDLAIAQRLEQWILGSDEALRPAMDAFFRGEERTVHSPEETVALLECALLDWRAAPGEPTLAELRIQEGTLASPEEHEVAVQMAASLPTLYRLDDFERGHSVLVTPLFPPGDPVLVADRSMSLTVEKGILMALRVYPAGPFHFARCFGHSLEAHQGKAFVRALRRKLRAHVRDGGAADPAGFLRERPFEILRLLREFEI